jgi:CheY-like chemotaxis protein
MDALSKDPINTPIIVVTAQTLEDSTKERVLKVAQDILVKPAESEHLFRVVSKYCPSLTRAL